MRSADELLSSIPGIRRTLASWREQVANLLLRNPVLVFSVLAAFTGPLMRRLRLEAGIIHIFGPTSIGKSTALCAAASVWPRHPFAGGDPHALFASWGTTQNGLEALAAERAETFLPLDELGLFPAGGDLGAAAYLVSGSGGKVTLTSTRKVRAPRSFIVSALSTGEISFRSRIEETGKRAFGGQLTRAVDIGVETIVTDPHGLTPAAYVAAVREAATANCGAAGVLFVQALCENLSEEGNEESLLAEVRRVTEILTPAGATAEQARVVRRFAGVWVAGLVASELEIVPYTPAEIEESVRYMCGLWWEGTAKNLPDDERALTALQSYLMRFGHTFPAASITRTGTGGARGYRSSNGSFYMTDDQLQEACGAADLKGLVTALRARKLLVREETGRNKKKVRIASLSDSFVRVYVIKRDILESEFGDDRAHASTGGEDAHEMDEVPSGDILDASAGDRPAPETDEELL